MVKKGQVSIFVIIVLVLVIAVSTFYLFTTLLNQQETEDLFDRTDLETISDYVEACLYDTAVDGLVLMGKQGGYIYVPEQIQSNIDASFSSDPSRTVVTPVWISGSLSYIPSEEKMIEDLTQFIDENIGDCVDSVRFFQDQPPVQTQGDPSSTVYFGRNDITIELFYPIVRNDTTGDRVRDEYAAEIDVPIRQLRDQAALLARELYDDQFFSRMTINLMSASDPIIPLSNIRFQCNTIQPWSVSQVREEIQELMYYSIPRVRVFGAEIAPFDEYDARDIREYNVLNQLGPDDLEDYFGPDYSQEILSGRGLPNDVYEFHNFVFESQYSNQLARNGITVGFRYRPEFGLRMNVRPSEDDVMRAQKGEGNADFLRFLCIQTYHFTYDVSYPVEVNLRKENAFKDGSSYIFRFGLPVTIEKNMPVNSDVFFSTNQPNIFSEEFCSDFVEDTTTILAYDRFSGDLLEDVSVRFECLTRYCPLGQTESQLNGYVALFANLPTGCFGGNFRAEKDGYLESVQDQITGIPDYVDIELTPIVDIPYRVLLNKNIPGILANPVSGDQMAIIKVDSLDFDYTEYFTYIENEAVPLQIIDYPGRYNVSVHVYDDNGLLGGYVNIIEFTEENIGDRLIIYAHSFGLPVTDDEEMMEKLEYLNSGEYVDEYRYEFI